MTEWLGGGIRYWASAYPFRPTPSRGIQEWLSQPLPAQPMNPTWDFLVMEIDYFGVQTALQQLLLANVTGLKQVFIEGMDRDMTLDRMPFINLRMPSSDQEVTTLGSTSYYEFIHLEVDVVAFHLAEFKAAAKIRDDLLRQARDAVVKNRVFHADLNTSRITGKIRFGALSPEGAGGHVALATFQVMAEAYLDT